MLVQHRAVCPYCSKPLKVGVPIDRPVVKAVATARCDNCQETVALDYEAELKLKVTVGRITWDRDPPVLEHGPDKQP